MLHFEHTHERLSGDLAMIAEGHKLSDVEKDRLRRSVVGAIPGNRDRPVFLLARAVLEANKSDLFSLILPGITPLRRSDAAFLDFLLTVATSDATSLDRIIHGFDTASPQHSSVQHFCSILTSVLHAYRRDVLPESRHHNVFTAIRRFYLHYRPEDPLPRNGDAVKFWSSVATRDFLTRYSTALNGLSDFGEAAQLAASWRHAVALDDQKALDLPSESSNDALSDVGMSSSTLKADINTIHECEIKLLLAHECKVLGRMAELVGAVLRLTNDTLAALAVGPVQNSVTEAARRSEIPPDIDSQMKKVPKYGAVVQQHLHLAQKIDDCLHLIHLSRGSSDEIATARSSISTDRRKRIDSMTRRQGYAGLDPITRMKLLREQIEPLLHLKAMLERYLKAWKVFESDDLVSLEAEHLLLFADKLNSLYLSNVSGVLR